MLLLRRRQANMTDKHLAVFQMRANGYSFVEIADALSLSDEQVQAINEYNLKHKKKLQVKSDLMV